MKLANIKDYAIEYVQSIDKGMLYLHPKYTAVINEIKRLKKERVERYLNHNSSVEIIKNILDDKIISDDGTYLEMDFIMLMHFLNFSGEVKKIPICNHKHPDFIISNKHYSAIVECTTLNLNEADTFRLNKQLTHVIQTESFMAPELYIPDEFLTILLGFKEFKKKIIDKVNQIQEYTAEKKLIKNIPKYIVIDLSWFIFDNRINCLTFIGQIMPNLRNSFLRGLGSDQQKWLLNTIGDIHRILSDTNITIVFVLNDIYEICNSQYGCLIAVDNEKIYPLTSNDLLNFTRVSPQTKYDLVFSEYVEQKWCENRLFHTEVSGRVTCPRFCNLIVKFIFEYFCYHLVGAKLNRQKWRREFIKHILYFEKINKSYGFNVSNMVNSTNFNKYLNNKKKLYYANNLELFYILHYSFEKLFYSMKVVNKIGDIHLFNCIHYQIGEIHYNSIKEKNKLIHDEVLKDRWYKAIDKLNIMRFNKFDTNYVLHLEVMFDII